MRHGKVVGKETTVGAGTGCQALEVRLLKRGRVVGVLQDDDEEVVESGPCG